MIKIIISLLVSLIVAISCKPKDEISLEEVISRFKANADKIDKVEYNMQRIDTFTSGCIWDNQGYALLEKDSSDKILGFSFYAKRNDVPSEFIYDDGKTFIISIDDRRYDVGRSSYGFIGSPGGQMVSQDIFHLDSVFQTADVIEQGNKIIVKYTFPDDTANNITDRIKIVEFDKSNYLPLRITQSLKALDKKSVTQMSFSDVKINGDVKDSIKAHKLPLAEFEVIQPEIRAASHLLNTNLPPTALPDVRDLSDTIKIDPGKVTLIDFWEVWCGPCIKSLPDMQALQNRFTDKIQVVGIVTQTETDVAVLLLDKKHISYPNLVATKDLWQHYGVNAIPYYLLVDKKGIIRHEFVGFSDEIEKRIGELVGE